MRQPNLQTERRVLLGTGVGGIDQSGDVAILCSHRHSHRRREMPVHHIQRPPQIAAASHRHRTEFVFGKLRVQPVKLRNPNRLTNLHKAQASAKTSPRRKRDKAYSHIHAPIRDGQCNINIARTEPEPRLPTSPPSKGMHGLAYATWRAQRT